MRKGELLSQQFPGGGEGGLGEEACSVPGLALLAGGEGGVPVGGERGGHSVGERRERRERGGEGVRGERERERRERGKRRERRERG